MWIVFRNLYYATLEYDEFEKRKKMSEKTSEKTPKKSNSLMSPSGNGQIPMTPNEKLIENGEKVSEVEVQDQINKSQALMKELNTTVSPTKDNKDGNGSFPYVIGGSVILASAGIIGYYLLKKNKGKKVA